MGLSQNFTTCHMAMFCRLDLETAMSASSRNPLKLTEGGVWGTRLHLDGPRDEGYAADSLALK